MTLSSTDNSRAGMVTSWKRSQSTETRESLTSNLIKEGIKEVKMQIMQITETLMAMTRHGKKLQVSGKNMYHKIVMKKPRISTFKTSCKRPKMNVIKARTLAAIIRMAQRPVDLSHQGVVTVGLSSRWKKMLTSM